MEKLLVLTVAGWRDARTGRGFIHLVIARETTVKAYHVDPALLPLITKMRESNGLQYHGQGTRGESIYI